MKRLYALTVLMSLMASVPAFAQIEAVEDDPILIGAVAGINYRMKQGTIETGDGCYACSSFSDGSGVGGMGGLRAILPLSRSLFLRAGVAAEIVNLDFDAVHNSYPYIEAHNTIGVLDLRQEMHLGFTSVMFEALLGYRVAKQGLYLVAGPVYNLLLSSQMKLNEEIISPSDASYLDGSRSKVLIDGDIPDASSFLSLRAGAGMTFPLGAGIHASPEIMYSFPLTDIGTDPGWSVSGLDLTLGVMWAM